MGRVIKTLTVERLRQALDYDRETGVFSWALPRIGMRAGTIAGSPHPGGYVAIRLDGRTYLAHRLAWLWVYGEWPALEIDHIDGDRANNAISNLRDVPRYMNSQNKKQANRDSKTGYLGVCRIPKGWKAQIGANGVHHNLGTYPTPEEAHEAYLAAKRALHPGYVDKDIIQSGMKG